MDELEELLELAARYEREGDDDAARGCLTLALSCEWKARHPHAEIIPLHGF